MRRACKGPGHMRVVVGYSTYGTHDTSVSQGIERLGAVEFEQNFVASRGGTLPSNGRLASFGVASPSRATGGQSK